MRFIPALSILVVAGLLTWFVVSTNAPDNRYAIKLGLDLAGGTELVYRADTSNITTDKQGALNSLREVIERRVNVFGVAEPLVQLERSSAVAGAVEDRLIVELPGVTDVNAAIAALGETPVLDFRLVKEGTEEAPEYEPTELTGRYLKNAELQFTSGTQSGLANQPVILLNFTEEGGDIFETITRENVGRQLAIFLDGAPISSPVIQEAIPGGSAVINGQFTPTEARDLVQNLNFGALPVPIDLVGSSAVGPTLGASAYDAGLLASVIGFAFVALFMILWYRVPGFVATIALVIYVIITVAIIKFIPVTLTASGIAGFILSIGMAVDANVLIFERMKEELRAGKPAHEAAKIGFSRAWPAIRDGHFTMIISSIILFWMGTSLVQGFALVFGFGVVVSLLSAVTITQTLLNTILPKETKGPWRFLLSSGIHTH
ncbi:MAG TPA: protein translocase subunit SecD [Candidatus Paceibacterota bacterium]|nr:protein translocase subunit SecD [Candidatus Paceibacterota bacterium]